MPRPSSWLYACRSRQQRLHLPASGDLRDPRRRVFVDRLVDSGPPGSGAEIAFDIAGLPAVACFFDQRGGVVVNVIINPTTDGYAAVRSTGTMSPTPKLKERGRTIKAECNRDIVSDQSAPQHPTIGHHHRRLPW
jgi:hypothetical protein